MLSNAFTDRPRLVFVVSILLTLAGLLSPTRIPVAQLPNNAQTVEAAIAQPTEAQMNGVEVIIYMESTSGNDGSYSLSISFEVGSNPDLNAVNVQNRVSLAESRLPEGIRRYSPWAPWRPAGAPSPPPCSAA